MLWSPPQTLPAKVEASLTSTSSEGTTVTASASTHTKGNYAQLISSTARDSYGITVLVNNVGTASVNSRMLVDIAIGAAASEVVLIPNLLAGNAAPWANVMGGGVLYHFPVFIPSGTRISARCQALISADTCAVYCWLHSYPTTAGGWVGQRVTAYGPNTSTSSGVAHTPGSSSAYATATQITASTTNPIRYMQVGIDTGTDTTAVNMRGMFRVGLGATPNYIVSSIPFAESTTVESMDNRMSNFFLSHLSFNVPAASDLRLSAMVSGTGESRGWAIYGVD